MNNLYDSLEEAAAYDRCEQYWEDGRKRVAEMKLSPSMKVLDIGSGPGILSIPLAKQVREVTAVEPSSAMRDLLKGHMTEEGIENIRILPFKWEDVPEEELGKYDLVIASYCLYMPDLLEAAQKMDRHSEGEIWVYWFAGETTGEHDTRILREKTGDPTPVKCHRKIDEFYNTLYQAGIYCDIRMLTDTSFDSEYGSWEEALEDHRRRRNLAEKDLPILEELLRERATVSEGKVILHDLNHYVLLRWQATRR